MFAQKKIAVGVTGGIAAYKTCELLRELKKNGAEVRVIMTQSAKEFVSPLTFTTLSENPILSSLFDQNGRSGVVHIDWARWFDALIICPATANILGKAASGIADDALSTTILATRAPVVFCPAMNSVMWANARVQDNVAALKRSGYHFVDPEWGELATRSEGEGWGRLAPVEHILHELKYLLLASDELAGKRVLVTAGPTHEAIDPVRFITNHSSGKMGFALAEAAKLKGAEVVLVCGPTPVPKPPGITCVEITTAQEMHDVVEREYADADILIMAAAVSDYRPKKFSNQKMKKTEDAVTLELTLTTDILAELAKKKQARVHVGFAVETENEMAYARKKLEAKNLDMIVLNNPSEPGAGFQWDTNKVTVITKDGAVEKIPKMSKFDVAQIILNKVSAILSKPPARKIANE